MKPCQLEALFLACRHAARACYTPLCTCGIAKSIMPAPSTRIVTSHPMPPLVVFGAQVVAPSRQGAQGAAKVQPAAAQTGGCGPTMQRLDSGPGSVYRQGGRPMATSQVGGAASRVGWGTRFTARPYTRFARHPSSGSNSLPRIQRSCTFCLPAATSGGSQRRHLAATSANLLLPIFRRHGRAQPPPLWTGRA